MQFWYTPSNTCKNAVHFLYYVFRDCGSYTFFPFCIIHQIRLLQWRTLASREDSDITDFTVSNAMPISAPQTGPHAHSNALHDQINHGINIGLKADTANAKVHPAHPPIHLPMNAPHRDLHTTAQVWHMPLFISMKIFFPVSF